MEPVVLSKMMPITAMVLSSRVPASLHTVCCRRIRSTDRLPRQPRGQHRVEASASNEGSPVRLPCTRVLISPRPSAPSIASRACLYRHVLLQWSSRQQLLIQHPARSRFWAPSRTNSRRQHCRVARNQPNLSSASTLARLRLPLGNAAVAVPCMRGNNIIAISQQHPWCESQRDRWRRHAPVSKRPPSGRSTWPLWCGRRGSRRAPPSPAVCSRPA